MKFRRDRNIIIKKDEVNWLNPALGMQKMTKMSYKP